MSKDGVIKFRSNWIKTAPLSFGLFEELNYWRNYFYELGLIGENSEGIGFGNISMRWEGEQFVITGTATGKINKLAKEHYSKVISFDIESNTVNAEGPINVSSESMSHAVLYSINSTINAVIHIHSKFMWEKYLHKLPTTDLDIEYGTPEMAKSIAKIYKETELATKKILVMGGHEDGIISFGSSISEAAEILKNYYFN